MIEALFVFGVLTCLAMVIHLITRYMGWDMAEDELNKELFEESKEEPKEEPKEGPFEEPKEEPKEELACKKILGTRNKT